VLESRSPTSGLQQCSDRLNRARCGIPLMIAVE
jgi:hypothetical protein